MRAEILYIEKCPSWHVAHHRLRAALDSVGRTDAPIALTLLSSAEQAASMPFTGSPTILIDGEDLFPLDEEVAELACRLYPGLGGATGAPSQAVIREALTKSSARGRVACSCCGRDRKRNRVHALGGGAYICRRCGLWVATRLRSD